MASVTRSVVAFVLVALQLMLTGWAPCARTPRDGVAAVPAVATEALPSAHAHHSAPAAPASHDGPGQTHNEGTACPMMGACGPTGIHQPVVVQAGPGPGHLAVRMPSIAAPELMPLSPEPPPPRG